MSSIQLTFQKKKIVLNRKVKNKTHTLTKDLCDVLNKMLGLAIFDPAPLTH